MQLRHFWLPALVLAAAIVTLPLLATARQEPREIRLVARQMAFYLDGDTAPNPVIRLKPGERVRLTLTNEDTGVLHDFTIRDLGVATATLKASERDSVVFEAPRRAANYRYTCRPHSKMMAGEVAVE